MQGNREQLVKDISQFMQHNVPMELLDEFHNKLRAHVMDGKAEFEPAWDGRGSFGKWKRPPQSYDVETLKLIASRSGGEIVMRVMLRPERFKPDDGDCSYVALGLVYFDGNLTVDGKDFEKVYGHWLSDGKLACEPYWMSDRSVVQ